IEQARAISRCPSPSSKRRRSTSLILRMDNLLVGTLSLPKFPSENSLPSVMSSATSSLWKTFRDHRNHRSENRDQLVTIGPESVIIFPRNPDHDHPGIAITIARNRRSPSPGIPTVRKKFPHPPIHLQITEINLSSSFRKAS